MAKRLIKRLERFLMHYNDLSKHQQAYVEFQINKIIEDPSINIKLGFRHELKQFSYDGWKVMSIDITEDERDCNKAKEFSKGYNRGKLRLVYRYKLIKDIIHINLTNCEQHYYMDKHYSINY